MVSRVTLSKMLLPMLGVINLPSLTIKKQAIGASDTLPEGVNIKAPS